MGFIGEWDAEADFVFFVSGESFLGDSIDWGHSSRWGSVDLRISEFSD